MWWKLGILALATAFLVISIIPMRTHAVALDPLKDSSSQPSSVTDMVGAMYLTPGAAVAIIAILAVAGFLAVRIVRSRK